MATDAWFSQWDEMHQKQEKLKQEDMKPKKKTKPITKPTTVVQLEHRTSKVVKIEAVNRTCYPWTFTLCAMIDENDGKTQTPFQWKGVEIGNAPLQRHMRNLQMNERIMVQSIEAETPMHNECFMVLARTEMLTKTFFQITNDETTLRIVIDWKTSELHPGHSFPCITYEFI